MESLNWLGESTFGLGLTSEVMSYGSKRDGTNGILYGGEQVILPDL